MFYEDANLWHILAVLSTVLSVVVVLVWQLWYSPAAEDNVEHSMDNENESLIKGTFGASLKGLKNQQNKKYKYERLEESEDDEDADTPICPVRPWQGEDEEGNLPEFEEDAEKTKSNKDKRSDAEPGTKVTSKHPINASRIGPPPKLPEFTEDDDNQINNFLSNNMDNLHGKLATVTLRQKAKQMEKELSAEERQQEAEIRRQQLASIFELMKDQSEKFGVNTDEDMVEQMHLYAL